MNKTKTLCKISLVSVALILLLVSCAALAATENDTGNATITDNYISSAASAATEQSASPAGTYAYVTTITRYGGAFGGDICVINTSTNEFTATIGVDGIPEEIAINPDGKKIYVTLKDIETISVIDTATLEYVATVPIKYPHGVAVSPDGTKVYVANSSTYDYYKGNVSIIDTATNKVTDMVKVGNYPYGIVVSPDGTKVYVTNHWDNTVSAIDIATNSVTATVPVGKAPAGVAFYPDGTKVYVANSGNNTVSVIDTATNTVIATVSVGDFPEGVAVSPDGTKVYVTNGDSNFDTVSVINTATNTVTATIDVGDFPHGVAVSPDGTKVYVANGIYDDLGGGYYGFVSVIDSSTNKVTARVSVLYIPQRIAVSPASEPMPPIANFSANSTSGEAPLTVAFTDISTGIPTKWKWNFGDGANSTVKNPVHKYSKAGKYTVSLTVKNAAGSNTTTKEDYINVTAPVKPIAAFSASPTSGNIPLKVTFSDKSTGSPTSWKWNFGDGKTSTSRNPAYTYTKAGKYTVSLTVKNAAGTNTKTIKDYITVKTAPVKPVAAFSATPTSGKAPLKVQFTDKSTGSPTSWKWSFGDGKTSTVKNPAHTYTKAGKYTVSLTVKNAAGSSTKTIKNYIVANELKAPVAAFSASPTSGKAPLKVQFTDKSSNNPTSWKWSFGDGTTSTKQNPTHKYSKAGKYTVSLTVKNAKGSNMATKTGYIKVVSKPVAAFSASPTTGKIPLKVTFTDKSTGTPTKWKWSFGDGTTSTKQNPIHKYSKAGKYTVSLTVSNAAGINTKKVSNYITAKK